MPITQATPQQLGSVGGQGAAAAIGAAGLTDTCEVWENQGFADSIGGSFDNWQPIGTYPCTPPVPHTPLNERTEADKITAIGIYVFQLPEDAIIDSGDRIKYRADFYEVQGRDRPISNATTISVRARLVE